MNNLSLLYQMSTVEEFNSTEKYTLIYAPNSNKRSYSSFYKLKDKIAIESIIELQYSKQSFPDDIKNEYKDIVVSICVDSNKTLLDNLRTIQDSVWSKRIMIDISGIYTPDLFTLLKFVKVSRKIEKVEAIYSMPYDYNFNKEPFTSYKSYDGDLSICEPIGYSGKSTGEGSSNLIIFLGFEGALSLKITEDYNNHKELILVNNLPSFFSKYKDISVLNNYDIISSDQKVYYTPADNPFETVNLLSMIIDETETVCISPLSTKPVSLGVCMFALNNNNVRILYPMSDKHKSQRTIDAYRTYYYEIPLSF